MSASEREKIFAAFEAAIEEENAAAQAMNLANQRYNTAKDAAAQARTQLDGVVAASADAALHGALDPEAVPADPPAPPTPPAPSEPPAPPVT